MNKIFKIIGLSTLICISILINKQTVSVISSYDEIMIKIEENKNQYDQKPINAIIKENTIIPGLNGRTVNIKKTYDEMKKIGTYNDKLYQYETIKPEITLKNNYDKYIISGNEQKNMASLIFIIKENSDILRINQILEDNNVKATFFIDTSWFEQNNDKIQNLIKEGHTIGSLGNNMDYEKVEYVWMNTIIKKIGIQNQNYCYAETENIKNLTACANLKNYTIMPNIIIKKNFISEIKKQLKSGSLISINANDSNINELDLVIKYIKSRDLKLVNLETHISEKKTN